MEGQKEGKEIEGWWGASHSLEFWGEDPESRVTVRQA